MIVRGEMADGRAPVGSDEILEEVGATAMFAPIGIGIGLLFSSVVIGALSFAPFALAAAAKGSSALSDIRHLRVTQRPQSLIPYDADLSVICECDARFPGMLCLRVTSARDGIGERLQTVFAVNAADVVSGAVAIEEGDGTVAVVRDGRGHETGVVLRLPGTEARRICEAMSALAEGIPAEDVAAIEAM